MTFKLRFTLYWAHQRLTKNNNNNRRKKTQRNKHHSITCKIQFFWYQKEEEKKNKYQLDLITLWFSSFGTMSGIFVRRVSPHHSRLILFVFLCTLNRIFNTTTTTTMSSSSTQKPFYLIIFNKWLRYLFIDQNRKKGQSKMSISD